MAASADLLCILSNFQFWIIVRWFFRLRIHFRFVVQNLNLLNLYFTGAAIPFYHLLFIIKIYRNIHEDVSKDFKINFIFDWIHKMRIFSNKNKNTDLCIMCAGFFSGFYYFFKKLSYVRIFFFGNNLVGLLEWASLDWDNEMHSMASSMVVEFNFCQFIMLFCKVFGWIIYTYLYLLIFSLVSIRALHLSCFRKSFITVQKKFLNENAFKNECQLDKASAFNGSSKKYNFAGIRSTPTSTPWNDTVIKYFEKFHS